MAGLAPIAGCAVGSNGKPRTESDAEGPYYPVVDMPLDISLITGDMFVGDELLFTGRVLDQAGRTLENVKVEIWQCDGNSIYSHPRAPQSENKDLNFRGFGAMFSSVTGAYEFRTIVPVAYSGRPPHIHVKLLRDGHELLTTQIYLEGQKGSNDRKIKPEVTGKNDIAKNLTRYEATFDFVI